MNTKTKDQRSLKNELESFKLKFLEKADSEKVKVYDEGIEAVARSGILEKAHKKGDKAPDFELKNATGESVKLSNYLRKGSVILTWYQNKAFKV